MVRKHLENLRTHLDEKPFICKECPKKFEKTRYLKEHILFVHQSTGEKSIVCDQCSKKISRSNFSKHLETHITNEKAHLCYYCAKSFALDRYLKQHVLNVHKGETFYPNKKSSKLFVQHAKMDLKFINNKVEDLDEITGINQSFKKEVLHDIEQNKTKISDEISNIKTNESEKQEILNETKNMETKYTNGDMEELSNIKENIQTNKNDEQEMFDEIEKDVDIESYDNYIQDNPIDKAFIKTENDDEISPANEFCKIELGEIKEENRSLDEFQCAICDFKTSKKWYLKRHTESIHSEMGSKKTYGFRS